jgi:hypothetical protein
MSECGSEIGQRVLPLCTSLCKRNLAIWGAGFLCAASSINVQLTNNLISDTSVIAQRPMITSIRNAALPRRVRRSHPGGSKMTKLLISAAALITLLVVTDAAFAAGASTFAPGRKSHHVQGTPGASFNSPGHMYLRAGKTSVRGHPGASGYAPGHHVH